MKILITGANGFIGKNLWVVLGRISDLTVLAYDVDDKPELLKEYLSQADAIFHLAGVNRPQRVEEFEEVNTGLTEQICHYLETRACFKAPALTSTGSSWFPERRTKSTSAPRSVRQK